MAEANKERTFIMIKPDGVQRGLVGAILGRFEQKGFQLVGLKQLTPTQDLLKKHYADLSAKPFFPGLISYMSTGPVVAMVWQGLNAVKTGRVMLGETNPQDSKVRSLFGCSPPFVFESVPKLELPTNFLSEFQTSSAWHDSW